MRQSSLHSLTTWLLPKAILVVGVLLGCIHLVKSVNTTPGNVTLGDSEMMGDAPNSSVCRRALRQATTQAAKCKVSREFPGCRFDSGFFSYLDFQYCYFNSPIPPTIIMVIWLVLLLGAFVVIADSFFSPSLIALARSMHMSQNLAGVTLLAFGNGAPDVFSAVTAITTGDPEAPDEGLGLGFLLGSGLLVNCVTAGLIMIIRPFKTARRPFIKDTIFYMCAVSWCGAILVRRMIYLSDSIGFICLYICYVLTTWLAERIRRYKSNSPAYRRLSTLFGSIIQHVHTICHRLCSCRLQSGSDSSSSETLEGVADAKITTAVGVGSGEEPKVSSGCRCSPSRHCKLANILRFRSKNNSVDLDRAENGILKSDTLENGNCIPVEDTKYRPGDVKIVGFRTKAEHDASISADHQNAVQPRIEITAPDDETASCSSPRSCTGRDLLDPRKLLQKHYPSPEQSTTDPRSTSTHQLPSQILSSPITSRRASQTGPCTSSMRKKSAVGGIGLKSRTPSMHQRQGSRRLSGMDQLPFVVRWIIANKEAEEKSFTEGTVGLSSVGEEKNKLPASHSATDFSLGSRYRYRHASDSTQAADISSMHTFDDRNLLCGNRGIYHRSPTVSFVDYHDEMPSSKTPSTSTLSELQLHKQQHTSTVSLPDLEPIVEDSDNSSKQPPPVILKPAVQFDYEENRIEEEDETFDTEPDPLIQWASKGQWHHLAYSLFPVDIGEWRNMTLIMRILQILEAPLFILFRLTIPVVFEELEEPSTALEIDDTDGCIEQPSTEVPTTNCQDVNPEREDEIGSSSTELRSSSSPGVILNFDHLHGWCRLLNCFQCLLTPTLWVMLITVGGMPLGLHVVGKSEMPVVTIVLLISTGLSITIFVTSRWDRAPLPYHRPFFAFLGFTTSVVWIYAIAHELVNSLEALGIVWEISEAILGISVMAFASSISDLMSNSLLAHNGYPRIAFSACIGSPLFNLLIGAGISYTIKLGRSGDHNAAMSFTLTHALLFTFLLVVLGSNLIMAIVCNFEMRKSYGIVLIIAYFIFLLVAILIEADVIASPPNWMLLTGTE